MFAAANKANSSLPEKLTAAKEASIDVMQQVSRSSCQSPQSPGPAMCGSATAHTNRKGDIVVRYVGPTMRLTEVDTTRTIVAALLGKGSRLESIFFRLGAKSRLCRYVLRLLWTLGAIIGLCALANILPTFCVWASLLMLPLPVVAIAVMGQQVFLLVWQTIESKILMTFELLLTTSAFALLWDQRCVFWASFYPTMFAALFTDAYPAKFRRSFCLFFYKGAALVQVAWDILVCSGWCEPLYAEYAVPIGKLPINLLSFTFTTSITLLLFYYRHLTTAYFNADALVVVKSSVETWRERVGHPDLFGEDISSRKLAPSVRKSIAKERAAATLKSSSQNSITAQSNFGSHEVAIVVSESTCVPSSSASRASSMPNRRDILIYQSCQDRLEHEVDTEAELSDATDSSLHCRPPPRQSESRKEGKEDLVAEVEIDHLAATVPPTSSGSRMVVACADRHHVHEAEEAQISDGMDSVQLLENLLRKSIPLSEETAQSLMNIITCTEGRQELVAGFDSGKSAASAPPTASRTDTASTILATPSAHVATPLQAESTPMLPRLDVATLAEGTLIPSMQNDEVPPYTSSHAVCGIGSDENDGESQSFLMDIAVSIQNEKHPR